jgi:L-fuculose-phosphate aldolase
MGSVSGRTETELRRQIVEIGRRVYDRFFIAANDGNISARLDDETVLITPTGVSKGFMSAEDILRVSLKGELLAASEGRWPTSETPMHLAIYRARADAGAVLHTHAPAATAFALTGVRLDEPTLPEVIVFIRAVAMVPYALPGSEELPQAMAPYLADHDVFLLGNHGAVTLGRTLEGAYYQMERLELVARIRLAAMALGPAHILSPEEVARLRALRDRAGG